MTIRSAQDELVTALKKIYDDREASTIADWTLEHVTGKKRVDRLITKDQQLDPGQQQALIQIQEKLLTHCPVQYALEEAWFAGMKFYVNENVLIPRPETEELVDWAALEIKNSQLKIKNILDIGTGSGCIPISLKKKCPDLSVTSIDVSEGALAVARQNATTLNAEVEFARVDFLEEKNWEPLSLFDIIISNPPYIKDSERVNMSKNVLDFEPQIALFVPDKDALLFYRKIVLFAKDHLAKDGRIFLEINEALGEEIIKLYEAGGYVVEIRKDLHGKDRMAKITQGPC